MQKKLSILLLAILSLVCILTACTKENPITAISIEGLESEYMVGSTINYDNLNLKITYQDGTTSTKKVSAAKSELGAVVTPADLSKVGETSVVVTIGEISKTVTIQVVEIIIDEIDGFEHPTFIKEYLARANDNSQSATSFKSQGQIYEVGNANAFVFDPLLSIWTADGEQDTISLSQVGATTSLKLYIGEDADAVTNAVADSDVKNYVTVVGSNYQFTQLATEVGFIKMEVTLSDVNYTHLIAPGTRDTLTLTFKVIDGGYNVYEQHGLSVMNDLIDFRIWADVWNVNVTTDGVMTEKSDSAPLTLPADNQALYKYVGNVDWLVLHGDITLDADKMPSDYFWSNNGESGKVYLWDGEKNVVYDQKTYYNTALNSLSNSQLFTTDQAKKDALNGSLIESTGYGSQGDGFDFNNVWYGNASKGLYATNKVSITGNYNAIIIPTEPSASGRKFQTTVSVGSSARVDNPYNQWHIFSMLDPEENFDTQLEMDFVVKNVAFNGNSGRSEAQGPKGLAMIHMGSKSLTTYNIVAQCFYTNYTPDNYGIPGEIHIQNSIITDTYNTMAVAWRSKIVVENSSLTYAGGPLFVMCDGNRSGGDGPGGWDYSENVTDGPALVVDDKSILESYATGNETWYTQLGEDESGTPFAAALFMQLKQINNSLTRDFGKSYVTKQMISGVEAEMMNVIAVYIVEGDNIFDLNGSAGYLPAGSFISDDFKMDMRADTVAQGVRQIATTVLIKSGLNIEDTIASLQTGGQNYSGLNYAYVADAENIPALGNPFAGNAMLEGMIEQQVRPQVLAQQAQIEAGVKSAIMQQYGMDETTFNAWVQDATNKATFDGAVNEQIEKLVDENVTVQASKIWSDAWKTQSSDKVGMWLPLAAVTQQPSTPYVGIILGDFKTVAN